MKVAGEGPRELPLVGCVCFFIVSKSGALTGPRTVADVMPVCFGWFPNISSKLMFGALTVFGASCADTYPGVVGRADNSAGSAGAGSGDETGGLFLKSVNRESWCADLGRWDYACGRCLIGCGKVVCYW